MTASIPYFDLKRQYQKLKSEYQAALLETAESGSYVLSASVREFEEKFSKYCGVSSALGVGSGTDALIFALRALGVGKGDEVIVPSYTFSATIFSIIHVGATPVFAEIDPETYTIDPTSIQNLITKRTKAILPVQLYGQMADMDPILSIARKKKLKVIEDACQAHGAQWKGKKSGALGDAGCFSFYPTKNLGAFGDGGALISNDKKLLERASYMRNLGRTDTKSPHKIVGWTSRLDALQAAILNIKLLHLDDFNKQRRRVASRYMARLQSTPLILPKEGKDRYHVYHLFVVRAPGKKRDALQKYLAEHQIGSFIHYPIPTHRQPAIRPYIKKAPKLPLTEKICGEILSLPIFPEMTDDEVDHVCNVIRNFYRL